MVFVTNLSNANSNCVCSVREATAFAATVCVQHMSQEYFWLGQLCVLVSLRSDRWIILEARRTPRRYHGSINYSVLMSCRCCPKMSCLSLQGCFSAKSCLAWSKATIRTQKRTQMEKYVHGKGCCALFMSQDGAVWLMLVILESYVKSCSSDIIIFAVSNCFLFAI